MSEDNGLNKEWRDMTDAELMAAHAWWVQAVEDASGWPSAHFAAQQIAAACTQAQRRGWRLENPYPIVIGR